MESPINPDNINRRQFLNLCAVALAACCIPSCGTNTPETLSTSTPPERNLIINDGVKDISFLIEEEKIKKLLGNELYEVFLETLNKHIQEYSCPIGEINIQVVGNTNVRGQLAVGNPGEIQLVSGRIAELIRDYNRLPQELKRISGGIDTIIGLIISHELFHACKPDDLLKVDIDLPEYKLKDFWGRDITVKITGFKGPAIYLSRSDGEIFIFAKAEESMAEFLARKLHLEGRHEVTKFIIADEYSRGVYFLEILEEKNIITQQDIINLFYTNNLPNFLKKFFNLNDEAELNSSHYYAYIWLFDKVWYGKISAQEAVELVMNIRNKKFSSVEINNTLQSYKSIGERRQNNRSFSDIGYKYKYYL